MHLTESAYPRYMICMDNTFAMHVPQIHTCREAVQLSIDVESAYFSEIYNNCNILGRKMQVCGI